MTVIGITGPTGAGKTTVLKEIEALGGAVIDCDAVYHEMLESDRALQENLERAFGPLRDGQGAIDRKKLGALVFGDPAKLERLNAIAQRGNFSVAPSASRVAKSLTLTTIPSIRKSKWGRDSSALSISSQTVSISSQNTR